MGYPWGFDPKDRDGSVVLFIPEGSASQRTLEAIADPESGEEFECSPCALTFRSVVTYRDRGNWEYEGNAEGADELIHETIKAGQGSESPAHQLLGYPLIVQNPMEEECQLASNGVYMGGATPQFDESLLESVGDWILLMQIDTDDNPGWMWGDMGMLYYWIRKQDLAARDFSKVWCILQCG